MKNNLLIAVFVIATAMFSGCAKDGAVGPAGPAGANGNANVNASTFSVTSWSNNGTLWYADFNVPSLTTDAQNGGAVEVFLSIDAGTTWFALPITDGNYLMDFLTQTNLVQVHWIYNAGLGNDPNTQLSATCQFKVVVIPPALMKSNPNANWKNYEEAKKVLNIQD